MNAAASNTTPVTAVGTFDVRFEPAEPTPAPAGAPAIARHGLDKTYRGALQGHARGTMLSAGEPQAGEAVYTALESFSGTLDGRSGGFALAHFGQLDAGVKELRVVIVPGSGTGALVGIRGELQIRNEGDQHHYVLTYRIE
ncbi:hypothetical protein WS63_15710 [Burkholderia stagnalis]|uniref:DUF3224 domain-containing protein n=1 Tax=Burkholderia stagnalis TaxID=1503054 RepID=UPI000759FC78|nr:DUF3224 domain-containing protein [Burkholderia stagnalis]KVD89367.1 hypothetical protein WS63_15710 [Burkholderia stagnalis]KWK18882.1 hypothetical protein WT77_25735 [Burkholderia stagnalis]